MMTRSMTRIAELEKENEKLKKENERLQKQTGDLWALASYSDYHQIEQLIELHGESRVKEVFAEDYQDYKDEQDDDEDSDEDSDEDGCVYCYYICRYCFAFGTEDPDCTKCGRKSCVLLYTEPNSSMALAKAKSKNDDDDEQDE